MQLQLDQAPRARATLQLRLAKGKKDLRRAQKLRYKVFAEEMGARLAGAENGLDSDEYDAYCDHLLVEDPANGKLVGTYRLLPPARAATLPQLYSEHEFDLSRLAGIRPHLIELGRSCVHKDYRRGAVIAMLWAGIADYVQQHGGQYLIGCASVSLADGGGQAVSLYRQLEAGHLSPPEWRVTPHLPLPLDRIAAPDVQAPLPPLIKGYLRAGAWICGEPAWDPDFNCADFFMLLPMNRLNLRHQRHFNTQG